MNDDFRRKGGLRDDRFRNDPQYTRSREPEGGFWQHGEEDRVARSPDQEFETSGNYREPRDDYANQGRGSARNGAPGYRSNLTDYANGAYDRNRFGGGHAPSYPTSPSYGREPAGAPRGGHAGRGPKGYTRTDERIREDVCDRLSWNDEVDATDIAVRVDQGEVTLEGSVETRHMKRLAAHLVEDVPGVVDVHNTIRVQKPMLTEIKEKLTGEASHDHYANTGTKTTGTSPVRNGVT